MTDKFYPETLKKLPVWILWKRELDSKGRLTKVLYSARYDGRASSTDSTTWTTYERVTEKYHSHISEYDGIGIVCSKEFRIVFIDIDHCINEEGEMSETALEITERLSKQYIELSQSGTGVHILALGEIPQNFKNSQNGVEMYDCKRFCALTGDAIKRSEPCEQAEDISYVYDKYKTQKKAKNGENKPVLTPENKLTLDDKDIIKKASLRGGKFTSLYDGDFISAGYSSQSEGDLALCIILAFWTDKDAERIDRLFRSSKLYREKWEREDYRTETIQSAIGHCEETLSEFILRKKREEAENYERAFLSEW